MDKTLDTLRVEAEINKLFYEAIKLSAETGKLNAERLKMGRERAWYPWMAVVGALGTAFGIGMAVAKMLH